MKQISIINGRNTALTPQYEASALEGLLKHAQSMRKGLLPTTKASDLEAYNSPSMARLMATPEAKAAGMAFLSELCAFWAQLVGGQHQAAIGVAAAQALASGDLLRKLGPAGLLNALNRRVNGMPPFAGNQAEFFTASSIAADLRTYAAWVAEEAAKAEAQEAKAQRDAYRQNALAFAETEAYKAVIDGITAKITSMEGGEL